MRVALRFLSVLALLSLTSCLTPEQAQGLQAFGAALQSAGAATDGISPPRAGTMGCMKTGEQVSGFNKMCFYNCMGSARAATIGSAELCPLTL